MAEMCLSLPTINEKSRGIAFPHLNEMLVHGNFTSPLPPHGSIFSGSPDNLLSQKENKNLFLGLVERYVPWDLTF